MLDLPSSPTTGQIFSSAGAMWKWDGTKWASYTTALSITMADTPPSAPAAGQGWWDSTSGQLYLYYSDPNSSQWVPAFNIPAGAATTPFLPIAGGALTGNLDVGYGVGSAPTFIELGNARTANGDAFIDLHAASGGGDYDFRIMRSSGLNGNALIENVGTGIFALRGSDLRTTGAIVICYNVSTADACAYIGRYRTGDGYAYIDLHTSADDNFDLRLLRNPGINGNGSITNGGSGTFSIWTNGVALVTVGVAGYALTVSGVVASQATQCRPGIAGPSIANVFNINWTGNAILWIDGVNCGIITLTSDYRIKENVADLPTMWDRVKALRPISYTIKDNTRLLSRASPEEEWGFIAHELQETLIPSASTGYKDSPNILQSPNIMTLVAPLTRALQEAMERIESLESRIAILSGA
jgi:hypothetical protein